jgi:metabotropic glutamate receptor 5
VALEQTIEFIGNSVLTVGDATVSTNDGRSRLAAIIGPGDSSITMQTHNILQLFEMPQIGYSATAKQLSDKEKFKYFTRVIASDTQQAQAIVDIIRQFQWSYVATIGTEGKSN